MCIGTGVEWGGISGIVIDFKTKLLTRIFYPFQNQRPEKNILNIDKNFFIDFSTKLMTIILPWCSNSLSCYCFSAQCSMASIHHEIVLTITGANQMGVFL